jgi:hypothetical protein
MEITFKSNFLDMCIRVGYVYNVTLEKYLGSAFNIRIGKILWSTGKGLRKLGE